MTIVRAEGSVQGAIERPSEYMPACFSAQASNLGVVSLSYPYIERWSCRRVSMNTHTTRCGFAFG